MSRRRGPETIPVIVVRPGADPVVEQIAPTLAGMQAIVGGYVEVCRLRIDGHEIDLWCDEDGRAKGLPPNRMVPAQGGGAHSIVGTFFLSAHVPGVDVVGFAPTYAALVSAFVAAWPRLVIAGTP